MIPRQLFDDPIETDVYRRIIDALRDYNFHPCMAYYETLSFTTHHGLAPLLRQTVFEHPNIVDILKTNLFGHAVDYCVRRVRKDWLPGEPKDHPFHQLLDAALEALPEDQEVKELRFLLEPRPTF